MDIAIEKKSNKKILAGTILGYVSFFINILSGLFLTPWIISKIGNSEYGIYTLCFSIINIFLFDFGLALTTNAYLSKLKAKNDLEGIEKFTSTIFKIYLIIDLIILLIFTIAFFLIDFVYVGMTPTEKSHLKVCFIIVGLFSLISFPTTVFNGTLYSNEKFALLRIADITNKIVLVILSVLAIKLNFGLYGLVASYAISGICAIAIKFIYFKYFLKAKLFSKHKAEKSYVFDILKFSIWAALLSLATRFVFNIAPSILGITSNSTQIAIFGIVTTIEGYIYTFGSMVSNLFMPKTFRALKNNYSKETIQKTAIKVGRLQSLMIIMIIFGFAACGKEFIMIWMKDNTYLPAYICILLVSVYQIFNIPEIVYYDSMMYIGKVRQLALVAIIKAVINLGLSFLLSYYYGTIGICISIGITRLLEQLAYNFIYKKYLKISFIELFEKSIFLPLLIGFVSFVISNRLGDLIPITNNTVGFIAKGAIFVVIYLFSISFVAKNDWNIRILKRA